MDTIKHYLSLSKLNLKSGITVSLVSIPLSVSLAVASRTTPIAGIITAIWAGMLAGIFGGSNYNIVGPTGALSGILASYSISYGSDSLPSICITSSLIIFVAYLLKLHKYLIFVPKSSIEGFTLGVSLVIGLNQLNSALGLQVSIIHKEFFENLLESFHNIKTISWGTTIIFILFLIGLFIFAFLFPKLPGAIILTPIGILLGYLSLNKYIPLILTTLGEKYPSMSAKLFTKWKFSSSDKLFSTSLTVAVVSIIETMLSAKIADGMTKTKHDKEKEMLGLFLANLFSGLFGGIPATSALARTALNVKTGATNKISAVISSFSIIIISFLLLPFFKYIPMAVIASILVFVALRMVEIHHYINMYKNDFTSLVLALLVAGVTVYFDPIYGILFGASISLLVFMNKLSEGQFETTIYKSEFEKLDHEEEIEINEEDENTIVYTIKGQLVHFNSQNHLHRIEELVKGTKNFIFRFRELYFIDLDGSQVLGEILELLKKNNIDIYITGISPNIKEILKQFPIYIELESQNFVLQKTSDVLRLLGIESGL